MRNQTRQQRGTRSITYMTVQTNRFRDEETCKSVTVSISDIVDVILEHRRRFGQESTVLTDVWIDVFRDGVFASQEGAEGMVEIEIGEVLWVILSAGDTARATYFMRMLTIFCVVRVALKTVILARTKAIGCPNILPLRLISPIAGW